MAVVFFAVALFHAPSVRHSFVNYDDNDYVLYNPKVLEGLTADGVAWAATSVGYAWNWHPLTWISLMTDVSLSGSELRALRADEPFPHPPYPEPVQRMSAVMHGHNVLLHAANAALLFLLMAIIGLSDHRIVEASAKWVFAFFALASLLWAVHPLRAEAVAWISERKELLCGFWSLLALIAHLRCRRAWLAVACLVMAVAAKPVAVTLPVVMWALDLVSARKVRVWRMAAYVLVAAAGCLLTLLAQRGNMAGLAQVSFGDRALNALAAPAIYLRQTIWPRGLVHFYMISNAVPIAEVVLGGALWTLGALACAWGAFRPSWASALAALAGSWCLVCLLPMSGIVQVGSQLHADRYTYWTGCGFTACMALALVRCPLWRSSARARAAAVATAAVALVPYGLFGFRQASVWRDSGTLLKHAYVATNTAKAAADWAEYLVQEDPVAAARVYRASLELGFTPPAASGLALMMATRPEASDFSEARRLAERAVAVDPAENRARVALGVCAIRENRFRDAEKLLSEAVAADAADGMAAGLLRQVRARCTAEGK